MYIILLFWVIVILKYGCIFSFCRFQWLLDFLVYLNNWKESTNNRPGNFSQNARGRMFLSWQTHEGSKITVYSIIEATKFLLAEGMEYVLTERFCQDPVEEYFGNQRKLGRRCDNPDVRSFGYHDNTIRIQRTISCQSGNTRGRKDRKKAWVEVCNEHFTCQKKAKELLSMSRFWLSMCLYIYIYIVYTLIRS